MRKNFNGLWAMAAERLAKILLMGLCFVLLTDKKDRVKILFWDGIGVWVLAKRLEKSQFIWLTYEGDKNITMEPRTLMMLIAGIDLKKRM